MTDMIVRPARETDLVSLNDLYNHYIRETPITFDIVSWTLEQRQEWFSHYHETGRRRLLVAVIGEQVIGYASSSMFRPKAAYQTSVETSIYVHHEHQGQKIGSLLYTQLFKLLAGEDVHCALAGVTLPNPASVALHKKFGFKDVGIYHEVGRKFDRYWDVAWFEKPLPVIAVAENQP
jgi:phosphinothricin acetyltransferase